MRVRHWMAVVALSSAWACGPGARPEVPCLDHEVCDDIDNDCNGLIDDEAIDARTWYADADNDGLGNPNDSVVACVAPPGFVGNANDCDDTVFDVKPSNTWYRDADGDGFGAAADSVVALEAPDGYVGCGGDCDDDDPTVFPGAPEICDDGVANDCDGDGLADCDHRDCAAEAYCAPTLDAVAPIGHSYRCQTRVTLFGSGFAALTGGRPTVTFSGVGACTDLTVVDDSTLTCMPPKVGAPAVSDVTVSTALGSATLPGAFRFEDVAPIYAADGKGGFAGSLYAIDPVCFTRTTVGNIRDTGGNRYGVTAMTFSGDGKLYAISSTADHGTVVPRLLTIDPATAIATVVGPTKASPTYGGFPDMTSVGSRLLAWREEGDVPVEVDPARGSVTVIGGSVGSSGSGLAADADGNVYFMPNGTSGTMYRVNPSTGATTATALVLSGAPSGLYQANSATFHRGDLLITAAESGGRSALCRVDLATGVVSQVADLPDQVDAIASANR